MLEDVWETDGSAVIISPFTSVCNKEFSIVQSIKLSKRRYTNNLLIHHVLGLFWRVWKGNIVSSTQVVTLCLNWMELIWRLVLPSKKLAVITLCMHYSTSIPKSLNKNAFRHRNPFASGHVWMFNCLQTDKHTWHRCIHAHRHRCKHMDPDTLTQKL